MAEKATTEMERIYTIPLRDVKTSPRNGQADRAVRAVKKYLTRHMKSEDIWIDASVNQALWAHGKFHIPSKIRVRARKFDDGVVEVSLPELDSTESIRGQIKARQEAAEEKEAKPEEPAAETPAAAAPTPGAAAETEEAPEEKKPEAKPEPAPTGKPDTTEKTAASKPEAKAEAKPEPAPTAKPEAAQKPAASTPEPAQKKPAAAEDTSEESARKPAKKAEDKGGSQ